MGVKLLRGRLGEPTNIWPGFVDILATLLIVIIFILMVFTVSQIYLSDAISGRDKALEKLRNQIEDLSKILIIESSEKQEALSQLKSSELQLQEELIEKEKLEKDVTKKKAEILSQSQQMINLGNQIQILTNELQIVAKALENFEKSEIVTLETKGLGERINKALALRVDQLKKLNDELALSKEEIAKQLIIVKESKEEIAKQMNVVEKLNAQLTIKDLALQEQVTQYQQLTKDLLAINESWGLEDASLTDQIQAIKEKNQELIQLNQNLVEKDTVIFDLRNKILELNKVLSMSEETQVAQQKTISDLTGKLSILENENLESKKLSIQNLTESEKKAESALQQVGELSNEIVKLNKEINTLNAALESSETDSLAKELKIEVLGERLNKALTNKVFELQKYRSEFFGRLQSILGDRKDIKIVGDRFIFESELLFDSGSATLQSAGKEKLKQIGLTLKETTTEIPGDIDWIIQVEGHSDRNPINTPEFPSNWELSTARANTVLKLLLDLGFSPNRLSAAGYGEFYPIAAGETDEDYRQNRRIELKLTSR